ncbi:hypothetical protein ACKI10_45240 [Streptomyces galilaeus]|uniref:Tip attachment protein J domain-containing protein n=1 Tax=Streptomyces galilaeus TaxID=33899 RepID=A0ABW9IDM4_STRGJ
MAFPQTPLDIQADLKIDGVWQNVTLDVYTRDIMTIVRGRPDEGARTDPGKCKLTFNNGASKAAPGVLGRYSQGNPLSDLFGKIGRNTPVRVHLPAAESHLELDGTLTGHVSTPHVAALNITGDLDVRMEFDADITDEGLNQTILGKWGPTVPERAWMVRAFAGNINLIWIDSGGNTQAVFMGAELYGGAALRATLDVDNGAAGFTAHFYQADSIDGPWTEISNGGIIGPATTSIQSTTSPLYIGPPDDTFTPDRQPFIGSGTRFQVRSGIDGTVVAAADFRPLADGATGFTDSAGRVWTVNGTATVRKREDRFVGEISAWPPRWDVSGNDRWVPVEAAGILRRLGQGAAALQSPLRRRIPAYSPLAYWPLEEGAQATQASSPIPGVAPLSLTRVNWAANDTLISSDSLPVWAAGSGASATMQGIVPAPPAGATGWQVAYLYRLDSIPPTLRTIMRINTTGTVREWRVQARDSQSKILGFDADGATIVDVSIATANNIFNTWIKSNFRVQQVGGNVQWWITWADISGDTGEFSATIAGTIGRVTLIGSPPGGYSSEVDGLSMGHIGVFGTTSTAAYNEAIAAWTPEAAGRRMLRLAQEENLPLSVRGIVEEQQDMGAQGLTSLLGLLAECADSDGGVLMEHRARPSLRYRGRATLYNQAPALVLNYAADGEVAPPLEPLDDDADVVNDVTVQRIDGSSGRVVLETGALSVQPPPAGVGRYDTSVQRSLARDDQTEPIAAWMLHLGTWDAPRYPVVHVNLAAAPHLIDEILTLDQGDLIRITNPPPWLPPGDINLIVQGYTESFDQYAWDVFFTCTPADPWTVAGLAYYEDFQDTTYTIPFTNGGTLPWTRSQVHFNSGTWSLRSGAIANNQTSDAIVAVPAGMTELRFWYWTSSEASGPGFEGDRLLVLVDGVQVLRAQGITPWTQAIVDVTGKSQVIFRYIKDNSSAGGEDAVYIDDLSFTGRAPARVDTDGSVLVNGVTAGATQLLVATPGAQPWATDPVHLPLDLTLGGEEVRATAIASSALDAFGRTLSGSWGSTDTGQAWFTVGGTVGTDYAVGSGYGSHVLTTVNASRRCGIDHLLADVDVAVNVTTSAAATGASLHGGPLARYVDADNLYMARLEFTTTNMVLLDVRKRTAAVESSLGTYVSPITHAPGTFVRCRLQVAGSTIRAKVWPASAPEPRAWHVVVEDTSVTTSTFVGCRSISAAGSTNVNPAVRYDQFEVLSPQNFTVVRARNGISKAQAAGASVSLVQPAPVPL